MLTDPGSENLPSTSEWLRRQLLEKQARNNRYSLRSFAKRCGLSVSTASEFLQGTKRPSAERLEEILARLGVAESAAREARLTLDFERVASPAARRAIANEIARIHDEGSEADREFRFSERDRAAVAAIVEEVKSRLSAFALNDARETAGLWVELRIGEGES